MADQAVETTNVAYEVTGSRNPVARKYFGQAHQQYFTPENLARFFYRIAYFAFNLHDTHNRYRRLSVLDPTAGSARLLVPFAEAHHRVMGIELDRRLVKVAQQAIGEENVREGDILLYGSLLKRYKLVVANPPYSLHWNVKDTPYENWELASEGGTIESQAFCLELAQHKLDQNGLLIILLSDKYLDQHTKVRQWLGKNFHLVANVTLAQPFKEEYGIEVDARLVVAVPKGWDKNTTKPGTLTGRFDNADEDLLLEIAAAFKQVRKSIYSYGGPVDWCQAEWDNGIPIPWDVPHVNLLADWQDRDTKPHLQVTDRGVRTMGSWANAWVNFLDMLPMQMYDAASGTQGNVKEALGSLPNLLINGTDAALDGWADLGFEVELSDHHREKLARRAKRYERDRLPIREMKPQELLAWFPDGPHKAIASGSIGRLPITEGEEYELQVRWNREDVTAGSEIVHTTDKSGKDKEVVVTTHVDRGHLEIKLHHKDDVSRRAIVTETDVKGVENFVNLFGLPKVQLVDTLPDFEGKVIALTRFIEQHNGRSGGRELYDTQQLDVARMAMKQNVALLYEQGGGKTATAAHWAVLRRYRSVLLVAPASVVPGILEDLERWGFPAKRISHNMIRKLLDKKRNRKLARQRVKSARLRKASGRATAADLELVELDDQREDLERQHAAKSRHVRNLWDIRNKGKLTSEKKKAAWNNDLDASVAAKSQLQGNIHRIYQQLGYEWDYSEGYRIPDFYVTSYQDVSLGDHMGVFDAWDHDHYDKDGEYIETIRGNRGARCNGHRCSGKRKMAVKECPICGNNWTGQGDGGGRVCRRCGYRAWTMGKYPVESLPLDRSVKARKKMIEIRKSIRMSSDVLKGTALDSTVRQWPMYKRMKAHLFGAVILDEAQDAKSRSALRGSAARAFRSNGRAILTGTWMKGYVIDLFFTAGWLCGFGSPLWPFNYNGGPPKFLKKFGTYQYVTRQFAETLEEGRRKLIPSVSNLNLLWKLLAAISIRRLKDDFLDDLPEKHVHYLWVDPADYSEHHEAILQQVMSEVSDVCKREMRKQKPNMQAISAALWWGRYATSCPNKYGAIHFAGGFGHMVSGDSGEGRKKAVLSAMHIENQYLKPLPGHEVSYDFAQVQKALELIKEIQEKGEKVVVFTSLIGLYETMKYAMASEFVPFMEIGNASTKKRNEIVRAFEASNKTVLLSATRKLNRGLTITKANHVIILNLEWSPEDTLQAEDRIHRPGQTKECHIYYVLAEGGMSMDTRMEELVYAKHQAQKAVQDRETQSADVADMLEQAVKARPEYAVAMSLGDENWIELRAKSLVNKVTARTAKTSKKKNGGPKEQANLFTVDNEGAVSTEWSIHVEKSVTVKVAENAEQGLLFS